MRSVRTRGDAGHFNNGGSVHFQCISMSFQGALQWQIPTFPTLPTTPTATFRKGVRVFHQKFGNGVVLNADGDHLEIAFKHAGVKKILAEYVDVVGA